MRAQLSSVGAMANDARRERAGSILINLQHSHDAGRRQMQFGMIGLGRMGDNMVLRPLRTGHACVVHDRQPVAMGRAMRLLLLGISGFFVDDGT